MLPQGITFSARGTASILDGLLGTGIDAAKALIALFVPNRFAIVYGNGAGRTVLLTKPTTHAVFVDVEGFGVPGEVLK